MRRTIVNCDKGACFHRTTVLGTGPIKQYEYRSSYSKEVPQSSSFEKFKKSRRNNPRYRICSELHQGFIIVLKVQIVNLKNTSNLDYRFLKAASKHEQIIPQHCI